VANAAMIRDQLLATGLAADTPAAVVEWGTCARQRVLTCNLGDLPATIADAGLGAPAIIVIGEVVRLRDRLSWERVTATAVACAQPRPSQI
jgi:siroheme synthase